MDTNLTSDESAAEGDVAEEESEGAVEEAIALDPPARHVLVLRLWYEIIIPSASSLLY